MHNIKQLFCKKFAPWKITIKEEEIFVGNKKKIPHQEWNIKWVVRKDNKGLFLEYYGIHKSQGHLHGRIYTSGEEEKLDVLKQYITYAPSVLGDREKSAREFESHNKKLMIELKEIGLM